MCSMSENLNNTETSLVQIVFLTHCSIKAAVCRIIKSIIIDLNGVPQLLWVFFVVLGIYSPSYQSGFGWSFWTHKSYVVLDVMLHYTTLFERHLASYRADCSEPAG